MSLCVFNDSGVCFVCGYKKRNPSTKVVRRCAPPPPQAAPRKAAAVERLDLEPGPSFATKIKNFAVAAAQHVAAGMPLASDEEIIRRHDICTGCEFFKDNACQKCGCPVVRAKQYVSKLSWADSECPVGKWGKETPTADPPQ